MSGLQHDAFDQWLLDETPDSGVVVSSRARIARNFPRQPFAPRANADQLRFVSEHAADAVSHMPTLSRFTRIDMDKVAPEERCFLRESYLISNDLEKGGNHRSVFVSPSMDASLMINEEDHLRLSTLVAGCRIEEAYKRLERLESELEQHLDLAYSDELGYLTACPTNTGTGLRLSALMHLPALTLLEQVEITLTDLPGYGLIVRGAYGENTENMGDLYQISNEVTLGRSEDELLELLQRIVRQVIEREMIARERLLREKRGQLEDVVCRAAGVLASARRIDSQEATMLLSRTRLGVGQPWGIGLTHAGLSRLFVRIQPGHLQCSRQDATEKNPIDSAGRPLDRDQERAALLRSVFGGGAAQNN